MFRDITIEEFLTRSANDDIDYSDFADYVNRETEKLNKKYGFLREVVKLEMKKNPEKITKKMFGLPVSIKDCICTKGIGSFAGSKILEGYKPVFDAHVVENLKKENGAILGKTNQDCFGFGTFSVYSDYEIPKNPIDSERSCGGSSGGCGGITKAATFPHISIGESTGGSISSPAAFCGVYGLTPTYGLVSRYGLIDYANSLDKIGVLGKNIFDIAFSLNIIAGHDSRDSTSLKTEKKDYTKVLDKPIKGIKIGIPKEYMQVDEKIQKTVWNAVKKLESLGATYQEISLENTKYALSAYYIIATAEASTNLAKYCGLRYGVQNEIAKAESFNDHYKKIRTKNFNAEAKRRIILGTFTRMSGYRDQYYLKAMKVRTLVINDFKRVFKNVDIIASPAMPITAPKFSDIEKLTPMEHYQMDVLTVPPNLAGVPMISVPCGFVDGLPVGLHLIADHLQEEKIIQAASWV
ncbi:MAG: aspartyl/glutamyl-tRNA amidotransferase subunit A [Candidatus Aenigmarchaeota archaeon]|nr:aspartyl/glutamyl-tRNA amidotransferase subunit A [Candidatus Aenigmarchaeota archaeon]